jgi:site-specific recombinase XerD
MAGVRTAEQVGDLTTLIPSFERSLRARNRSPKTIRSYLDVSRMFVAFLQQRGMPTIAEQLTREHVEAYIDDQLQRWSPSTAATRHRCIQQLFRWLEEEGEINRNPMAKMRPPTVPESPVPVVPDDDLRRLLVACSGKEFDARRDTALVRLFLDTGCRLAEVTGLRVEDIDFELQTVGVIGKGRRPRAVPFGPKTLSWSPKSDLLPRRRVSRRPRLGRTSCASLFVALDSRTTQSESACLTPPPEVAD